MADADRSEDGGDGADPPHGSESGISSDAEKNDGLGGMGTGDTSHQAGGRKARFLWSQVSIRLPRMHADPCNILRILFRTGRGDSELENAQLKALFESHMAFHGMFSLNWAIVDCYDWHLPRTLCRKWR